MRQLHRVLLGLALVCAFVAGAAQPSTAQNITTGDIVGVVMDAQKGVLPGATVVAVHVPTGTSYEATTQADGRFTILQVRVGGPYTVTATMSGFKTEEVTNIAVALGETRTVSFTLSIAGVTETVNVIADAQVIDTQRAGTAANIAQQTIDTLPTIARSLTDIARIQPQFNSMGSGAGDGASVLSVAGTSFRYNSLQIDGAANNDLFGLASSAGAPGGTAETQPVSLDAIQELQLVVSPYDVRQGGFAGGGVNAITKSGTNSYHGTIYYFGRNQNWVGQLNKENLATSTSVAKISTFSDMQTGGSIGGPVVKNKLFFFGTLDFARKDRPTGYSVSSTGQNFGNEALIDQFLTDLQKYGYSIPNAKTEFTRATNSNKYFGRGDWNLTRNHRLTIRNNTITSFNDIAGNPSTSSYRFADNFYRYVSNTSSTVGQLNSTLGQSVNEFRITYTRVRDHRENPLPGQPLFPMVTVTLAPGRTAVAGTERYSSRNAIDQDIIELNDAYTKMKGTHQFTLGTHNEFLSLSNLFIRDNIGTYSFTSLANFEAGLAQSYDRSYSLTPDPKQPAAFSVRQWGFYGGDTWRVKPNFTLTYGLRVDAPTFPKTPTANPQAVAAFGYATDVVPNSVEWSPRVGFNWDTKGDQSQQIRGGLGMFTGRPSYVWLSNQYGNTGVDFQRIGASSNSSNKIPFVADPNNQPTTVTGAKAGVYYNEIDLIDPNFKFPSVLRGNIGFDRKLPWGFVGTAEFLWTKTLKDIAYNNVNLTVNPTAVTFMGRPFMQQVVSTISNAPLLQNTSQGYSWNMSYEARKRMSHGFTMAASYSYGVAKSIMDGTSDQAISNWGNVYTPGSPNSIPLARSNFDPGHRINFTASYDFKVYKANRGTISLFYSGQSGRPYALTVYGDVNNDTYGNDLAYLPSSASQMVISGGTYQDLTNWLNAEPCLAGFVGQIIPRNGCRGPWINTLDARLAFQVPLGKARAEITLDTLNLLNLLNTKWGVLRYVSYGQNTSLTRTVINPATGLPSTSTTPSATNPWVGYDLTYMLSSQRYLFDNLRSRWQLQLGGRLRF